MKISCFTLRDALTLVSALCFSFAVSAEPTVLRPILEKWNIQTGFFEDFNVESNSSASGGAFSRDELSASLSNRKKIVRIVRSNGLSNLGMRNLIRDQIRRLRGEFSSQLTDKVQNSIRNECALPKVSRFGNSNSTRFIWTTLAERSLRFGICDKKRAEYNAVVVLLKCASVAVYEFYYYFPKSDDPKPIADKMMKISCGK